MASCVRNICTKNYQNLITGFQVTIENVGDVFFIRLRSHHTVLRDSDWVSVISQKRIQYKLQKATHTGQ